MDIKLVNRNQIKCTLTNLDLGVRNLKMSELTYGSFQANKLIDEMLKKASSEYGFDVSDTSLMIETIPEVDDGITVIITKVEDPEEMDTRLSKFYTPQSKNLPDFQTDNVLEGASISNSLSEIFNNVQRENDVESKTQSYFVYSFKNIDSVIKAAKAIKAGEEIITSLYKDEQTSMYYLILENKMESSLYNGLSIVSVCNILSEYGKRVQALYATKAHFDEHFSLIIADKALQALSNV